VTEEQVEQCAHRPSRSAEGVGSGTVQGRTSARRAISSMIWVHLRRKLKVADAADRQCNALDLDSWRGGSHPFSSFAW